LEWNGYKGGETGLRRERTKGRKGKEKEGKGGVEGEGQGFGK
jgi:hypothetical protein